MSTINSLYSEYEKGITVEQKLQQIYHDIEKDNQSKDPINAFISFNKDIALKEAQKSLDLKKPLAGVFVAVKDNIHIKGLKTTCASHILENYEAIYNATVVDKLKEAGAIIIGKLNMDQFAMGATNETSFFGNVRNPYNRSCSAGGSSGGSAAALAAGFSYLTLGTDTGGSIRIPASYCGIVGLKPTYGAVSRYGVMSMAAGLDQVGPMANNVQDCALLFNVIKGYDENDPNSFDHPGVDINRIKNPQGCKKIGIVKQFVQDLIKPDVLNQFYKTVDRLKDLGHTVEEIDIPHVSYSIMSYFILSRVQSFSALSMLDGVRYGVRQETNDLIQNYEETRGQGFSFEIIKRQLCGHYFLSSTHHYNQARKMQTVLFNDVQKAFSQYDVLISPTSISSAPRLGQTSAFKVEGYLVDSIASLANLTTIPALSVNMGHDAQKMPIGIQIMGNLKEEQSLFELAYQIQQIQPSEFL